MTTSTIQDSTLLYKKTLLKKVLLICGIISSLLYIAMNIFIPMLYPGYSSFYHTVSELSAIGAPTRQLWVVLVTIYTLLVAAFGFAVLMSAHGNRALRIVGILMIIHGIIGLFWPPMHQREVLAAGGGTMTDTLHIVWTMITVPLMMLEIGFGAAALSKWFRFYSIITLLILPVFGILTGMDSHKMEANLPTPWMGVWECISIAVFMIWIIEFSIILLRRAQHPDAIDGQSAG